MTKKLLSTLLLSFDLLFILISTGTITYNFPSLSKNYEKLLIEKIVLHELWQDENNLKTIPDRTIRILWNKKIEEKKWQPLIYDSRYYKKENFDTCLSPNSLKIYKIQKNENEYMAWVTPFSPNVCIRYILIPILFGILIILVLHCIFILLFIKPSASTKRMKNKINKEEGVPTQTYDLTPEEIEGLLGTPEERTENIKNDL